MQSSSAPSSITDRGSFEARYLAFLETVSHLRPTLHRYCARMTGSVLDGEDVMQDALFQAYRNIDAFDDTRPMSPWLFRVAHNQCIDFLRRRAVRERAEAEIDYESSVEPVEAIGPELGRAVEHLVLSLPPKERACVLLKDVFGHSLEEIAELVGSTVGGVKAALNRGRTKLSSLPQPVPTPAPAPRSPLLDLYVERFNRRDWDGVRELIASDARISVADRFAGPLSAAPYFANYEARRGVWRASPGMVDGEPVAIIRQQKPGEHAWTVLSVVRLHATGSDIDQVTDYTHCPWVIEAAGEWRILD